MNFLAPWMLFGSAAVAIPIALHFFFRTRYRTVPWAAMKFLLASIEQTSRRLRFQELLLLITRCLVLAALAFAMARPMTTVVRGSGRGDAVDAVFVMDVSYSMGARDGAATRLQRAKNAALEALDKLPAHSTAQIVACADRVVSVGPRAPSNLDQARSLIKDLELTSLATDLTPGVVEAKTLLDRGQLPNKELYVFSDFQKSGWEQQPSTLLDGFRELKEKATITLVRCGTRPIKNAAIVGISAQAGIPRPNQRSSFAVLVRNTGNEPMSDVRVALSADGDEKKGETQTIPMLGPNETRAVTLTAQFDKSGPRVLTARILFDEMDGDNRYDQVIPVHEQVNVLVVNGGTNELDASRSSTFFLNLALVPVSDANRSKFYLQFREVEPRLATPALLAKTDLCILVNVGMPGEGARGVELAGRRSTAPADFLAELGTWVRQGHGMLIVPGNNTIAEAYNRVLGKNLGLLPLPLKGVRDLAAESDKQKRLSRSSFTLPALRQFKEDKYYETLDVTLVSRAIELDESGEAKGAEGSRQVVARLANGLPFLAIRHVDAGEVVMLTTAFEPSWSDPNPVLTVPMVQTLVAHLLHSQTPNQNLVAGESLTCYPRDKEVHSYNLKPPSGPSIRLLPEVKEKRQVLSVGDLHQAGVYRLLAKTVTQEAAMADVGIPIAVTPDLRESQDLSTLTDEQLDSRLGFTPLHATAGIEGAAATGLDRYRREWTLWVLAAVLVLAVGEALLAWLCGRSW
jgi:hypothetical protein